MSLASPSAMTATNPDSFAVVDLTLTGRLDAAATLALREAAASVLKDGPCLMLLDVDDLTTVDASGVVGLLELLRLIRSAGGDLRLFGSSKTLEATRLDAHLGYVARVYRSRFHAADSRPERIRARGTNTSDGLWGRVARSMRKPRWI